MESFFENEIFKQKIYSWSSFQLKYFGVVWFWKEFFTTRRILKKFLHPVRFKNEIFWFSKGQSNLSPQHELFESFSPTKPGACTAYIIHIQEKLEIAVQTIAFVLFSTTNLRLFLLCCSTYFSAWNLNVQKLAAGKSAIKTRTIFLSHMCDYFGKR